MSNGRIYFEGNPWPEGHAINVFRWDSQVHDGNVWFQLHLETEDYDAERRINNDDDVAYASDWEAPGVWENYQECTLSSIAWHDGGFFVCPVKEYASEWLNGREFRVDPLPFSADVEWDELAFGIYLLGHDSVADHSIKLFRTESGDTFDISWQGKIALTYAGKHEYKYTFRAEINNAKAPTLSNP